jgi:hypothetical protein
VTEGDRAWLGVLCYVVAYDAWAMIHGRETLSHSYYRAIQHPLRRWPTVLVWAVLTLHLFHLIPDRLDPLRAPFASARTRRSA